MKLSQTEQNAALQIAQDVTDDGLVIQTQRGTPNKESLRVEVSFEASERGYDAATAEAMGKYAAKR